MSDKIIYKGRGNPELYDDLMDFMNYVFGFDGVREHFVRLLPKLYKPEHDPCHNNYIVTENGKLKAAVGAFDLELSVAGLTLSCRGIGNVATHPNCRGQGLMQECITLALDDMIRDQVDLSVLGGQRQRYEYFGFEPCGVEYDAYCTNRNQRHYYRDVPFCELELRQLKKDDTDLLKQIFELHRSKPYHSVRAEEDLFDILCTWHQDPVAILRDGTFIGYYTGDLEELTLIDMDDFGDVIRNFIRQNGSVHVKFPSYDLPLLKKIAPLCDSLDMSNAEMFNVLNYRNVIEAFLRLKAAAEPLPDGSVCVLIHGWAKDEQLKITVKDNTVTVTPTRARPEFVLDHLEAMSFLFGLYSPAREQLKPAVRAWLPVPIYMYKPDQV